jgi:hypothetical protein
MPITYASEADRIAARMDDLLARLNDRDRAAIEKHLATCDAEPDRTHGNLWRRLAGLLAALTTVIPRRRGVQALQFFTPDGTYRKQVFALEDRHNGVVVLYLPDVLEKALARNVLARDGENFSLPGSPGHALCITIITAASSPGAPEHVEHMLGWNRKALRIVIGSNQSKPGELNAVESLCRIAAEDWSKP